MAAPTFTLPGVAAPTFFAPGQAAGAPAFVLPGQAVTLKIRGWSIDAALRTAGYDPKTRQYVDPKVDPRLQSYLKVSSSKAKQATAKRSAKERKPPTGSVEGTPTAIYQNLRGGSPWAAVGHPSKAAPRNPDWVYVSGLLAGIQGPDLVRLVGEPADVQRELQRALNTLGMGQYLNQVWNTQINAGNVEQVLGELARQETAQRTQARAAKTRILDWLILSQQVDQAIGILARQGQLARRIVDPEKVKAARGRGGLAAKLRQWQTAVQSDQSMRVDVTNLRRGETGVGSKMVLVSGAAGEIKTGTFGPSNNPNFPIISRDPATFALAMEIMAAVSGDRNWLSYMWGQATGPAAGYPSIPPAPAKGAKAAPAQQTQLGQAAVAAGVPSGPITLPGQQVAAPTQFAQQLQIAQPQQQQFIQPQQQQQFTIQPPQQQLQIAQPQQQLQIAPPAQTILAPTPLVPTVAQPSPLNIPRPMTPPGTLVAQPAITLAQPGAGLTSALAQAPAGTVISEAVAPGTVMQPALTFGAPTGAVLSRQGLPGIVPSRTGVIGPGVAASQATMTGLGSPTIRAGSIRQ